MTEFSNFMQEFVKANIVLSGSKVSMSITNVIKLNSVFPLRVKDSNAERGGGGKGQLFPFPFSKRGRGRQEVPCSIPKNLFDYQSDKSINHGLLNCQ